MYSKYRKLVIRIILLLVFITAVGFNSKSVKAGGKGIYNNGLAGINIDIYSPPYKTMANVETWGQYAYGLSGGAWYATSRVLDLTGANLITIYSGTKWYNEVYSNFGFERGYNLSLTEKAIGYFKDRLVIVEKVEGDTVYISEGANKDTAYKDNDYCTITAVSKSLFMSDNFVGFVYLGVGFDSDPFVISFSDVTVDSAYPNDAKLQVNIVNSCRYVVEKLGCYLYDADGKLLKSYYEQCNLSFRSFWYKCGINYEMQYYLEENTWYKCILYAVVNGKEYQYDKPLTFRTKIDADKESPVISDVKVVEIDSLGYTIECSVTDEYEIDRVQFPTWTNNNYQDDIAPNWGSNPAVKGYEYNGKYRFRVNRSDHNNEYGSYQTNIYAYDTNGNYSSYSESVLTDITIQAGFKPFNISHYNNMIISAFNEQLKWDDAKSVVSSMNSRLVQVENEEKNNAVFSIIKDQYRPFYYMGGFQNGVGATWNWISGNPMTYSNWDDVQPDCAGNNEFYLTMISSTGKWNDVPDWCDDGFLMETSIDLKPIASIALDGKIYEFYNEHLPYSVARYFCMLKGKQLAKVNSEKINDALTSVVDSQNKYYYIGATDEIQEGSFVWEDGTPVEYNNWSEGEPNDFSANGGEDYAAIYPGGIWNDDVIQGNDGFVTEYEGTLPAAVPTLTPSMSPEPTTLPTFTPSKAPEISAKPTTNPTDKPSPTAKATQTPKPTLTPSAIPTAAPTAVSKLPTATPTAIPTKEPTTVPTAVSTVVPTTIPAIIPSAVPEPLLKPTTPPAPTITSSAPDTRKIKNLTVKTPDNTYISLKWSLEPSAVSYVILRSTSQKRGYKVIETVDSSACSYIDKNISSGVTYYYKLKMFQKNGQTEATGYSDIVSASVNGMFRPILNIKKMHKGEVNYLVIKLKKYSGDYVQIHVKKGNGKFKLLKLNYNIIKRYKGIFKIKYIVKNQKLSIKVRTFIKKKNKPIYSGYSKVWKVRT